MTRSIMLTLAMVLFAAGTATAQQVAVPQPQAVRVAQPTRSYRSYSVTPSPASAATMGDVRPAGRHAGEASWRHATAKAAGHYNGGR
ncbi:MAG: hypothetical protein EBR28_04645 [Planctomycetia bacterium]|nr:hypothetical protein [Planctomycetia bacterium]